MYCSSRVTQGLKKEANLMFQFGLQLLRVRSFMLHFCLSSCVLGTREKGEQAAETTGISMVSFMALLLLVLHHVQLSSTRKYQT